MQIQNIFSDVDERLYSVLMNEEELSLFSELEERLYAINQVKPTMSEAFKGIGGQLKKGNKKANKAAVKSALEKIPEKIWPHDLRDLLYKTSKGKIDPLKFDTEGFLKKYTTRRQYGTPKPIPSPKHRVHELIPSYEFNESESPVELARWYKRNGDKDLTIFKDTYLGTC